MYSENRLPQNLDAEESVLGAILLDPYCLDNVKQVLSPEDFYDNAHRLIFEAMMALHKRQKRPDLMTVTDYLDKINQLELVGGQPKLGGILAGCVSSHNADIHAQLVREKSLERQLVLFGDTVKSQASRPLSNPADILSTAKHQLKALESAWKLTKGDRQDEIDFHLLDQELEEIEAIEDPAKRRWLKLKLRKRWGIRSSRELDELHTSWLMGRSTLELCNPRQFFKEHSKNIKFHLESFIPEKSIILLHSLGGTGKTRLVMSMIRALIAGESWGEYRVDKPCRVLLIQSDQGSAITARLLDVGGFLGLPDHLLSNLAIPNRHWAIDDVGALKKAIATHKPDVIVVDSLTSVNASSIVSENDVEYARPLIRLRKFTEDYGCSFLIIHHSNQQGGSRGTSAIRNTVDEVWKLERDTKDPEQIHNLLTIEKTRSRAPGTYRLRYDDESASWTVTAKMQGELPEVKSNWKSQLLAYLQDREGQGLTRQEITDGLHMNAHTCRRELSSLLGEGQINTCRGQSRSVLYYWGDRYPFNALMDSDQSDRNCDQVDQNSDHIPNPDGVIYSAQKIFKDQNDQPDLNFVSDQKTKITDLSDLSLEKSPEPLPHKEEFKDQSSDQPDHNSDHFDHIFQVGDRIVCRDGGMKDLDIVRSEFDCLYLVCQIVGSTETLEFTDQELKDYGYEKRAEPSEKTPPLPTIGDRVYRKPDYRRGLSLICGKVTAINGDEYETDQAIRFSVDAWNRGYWLPAPNPESEMPPVHARIYAKVNYEFCPVQVTSVGKTKFSATDKNGTKRSGLKDWRWEA